MKPLNAVRTKTGTTERRYEKDAATPAMDFHELRFVHGIVIVIDHLRASSKPRNHDDHHHQGHACT
jgi:hypothetical protein